MPDDRPAPNRVTPKRPAAKRTASAQRAVQSVEVGGRLLLALADHPEAMNLKDLAQRAGLSPARAHPYLVSFGRLRLVEQDRLTGRYALGPAALQLGLTALHQLDAIRVAESVAQGLSDRTGHAVALAVWGNFGPTVVRMIEAQQPLLVSMRAGTVMSLLNTATGRAFAASMSPQRLTRSLDLHHGAVGDPSGTRRGLSAPDLAIVEAARRDLRLHGVVRAKGRPIPGINAFSAPVLNHEGQPVLVMTALDREGRLPVDWTHASARALADCAAEVSTQLGWRAGSPAWRP